MTGNPLSGHTKANAGSMSGNASFTDGLTDGEHIVSPTLTNLLEGVHSNGIILEEDTANTDSDRNTPEDLPGVCEQVTNTYTVRVAGGHVVIDGVLYEFANGPGSSADIALTSSSANARASYSALSSGQEVAIVIYASTDTTNDCITWEMGTPITTAANAYPTTPSAFLSEPKSSLGVKQSVVLAVMRATYSASGGDLKLNLTESNDKRVFVRPTPLYLTPVVSGAVGGTTGVTNIDTLHSGQTGSLSGSRLGAIWQSYNGDGGANLYYSAKDNGGTRHTHLLGPTYVDVSSPSTNQTFTMGSDRIFVLTPSTTINLNPSGTFPQGYTVFVSVPSGSTVTFDSTGLNSNVVATEATMFAYTGSAWKKVLVSGTVSPSDADEVSVAATPTNYTAATADVEAHLAGIDTALGSTISEVKNDTTPQLGGNLDVNSYSIVSDSGNENIVIAPHGSGQVVIGNQTETVNRITSNGARDLKMEANSGVGASITLQDGTNADIVITPAGTGSVGIGTTSPSELLHLADADGTEPTLLIENTGTAADEPEIVFLRSGTAAVGQDIGHIRWKAQNDAAETINYFTMFADAADETDGTEDGRMIMYTMRAGTLTESFRTEGVRVSVNAGANDVDFRVSGDNQTNLLYTDALNDRVGIGTNTPSVLFDVNGAMKSTSLESKRLPTTSITTATTLVEATHAGRYLICTANVTLPATSTAGEHYTILNTSGSDITIGRNSNDINGASSDVTVSTYNGATCIAIGSNDWIVLGV